MKKIIIVFVLAAAVGFPAVHHFIGTSVEENFRIEHEEVAAESALSGFNVDLVDYKRGLFSATATTRISPIVQDGAESFSLELIHHINHTPNPVSQVIATVDTGVVLSEDAKEALAPLFKEQAPLDIHTRIFFDGHQEATITSPAVSGELNGKEAVAVEWKGLQGTAWQSAGRDKLKFKLNSPGVILKNADIEPQADSQAKATDATVVDESVVPTEAAERQFQSVSVTELQYEVDLHKGESGMWMGQASASIGGFDIGAVDVGGKAFAMHIDNIDMSGDQDESNGLVKASGLIKTKMINVDGFELTNAVYDVGVENLDAKALHAWQSTMTQVLKDEVKSADPFSPLLEQLPALVNAQPVLKVNDLSVDSPMGRFAFKLDSRITGEWNDMLMENPAMLVTMVKAELDASVPKAAVISSLQDNIRASVIANSTARQVEMSREEVDKIVQQTAEQQLGGLVQQGYLKEVGEQYDSHIEYDAGMLTINGMDASPLLGALMQ